MKKEPLINPTWDRIAFIFQGGGALGAFQVGIYEAIHNAGYNLDWVSGISIGAINAAIIAGNKPENRVEKLKEFWQIITTPTHFSWWDAYIDSMDMRRFYNQFHAQTTLLYGQPGFFQPRLFNPHFITNATPDEISFYDTSLLRETLDHVIDFDVLNNGKIRLTLSAVRLDNGQHVLFDTKYQKLYPEHIMASGALPPGFPAVKIDGTYYWDGGIVNNTPIEVILNDLPRISTLCFMVQLFDPESKIPTTLDEILLKQKDLTYASHYKRVIKSFCEAHDLRHAIAELYDLLPANLKENPQIKEIRSVGCHTVMSLVRFHRHGLNTDLSSKDYAFSSLSINESIRLGHEQATEALKKSLWLQPIPKNVGAILYDMCPHDETETIFEHGKKKKKKSPQ
ncbi:patatin-like phospholipase family protein [Legionella hackeliae]|uniref:Putative patatin-like phospholipase n=1 Tax=Legionella hackeliae TaxID=449 RepID=A0A0A8UTW9_LEGHA|nr:patatin-like phospholipase family protein [Legionella hackeliae]KTD13836.1 patatin-like phospholipase [Legionella hackeliae]CEK10537.1 putative patatin-like phospholipase [Legionella hackeliae]STX47275.1 patatin-like phospholipase [Legionella hackeliae]